MSVVEKMVLYGWSLKYLMLRVRKIGNKLRN